MKILAIALKDFLSAYRSMFALVFMFGVPLLMTAMFYFMFGNLNTNDGFALPSTKVMVANLDEGDPQTGQVGKLVVETLQNDDLSGLMEVTIAADESTARRAVDTQQAGVAVIIPAGFSASFADTESAAEIQVYTDPTLTIGPAIVQSVLSQVTDSLAGVKIAVNLALKQAEAGEISYEQISPLVDAYHKSIQPEGDPSSALVNVRAPAAAPVENMMLRIVGPIMGGMMIFYAFYTGMSTGQSILREEEAGTMPRLFTTPTTQAEILAGKFLAIGLTVSVQIIVLLIAGRLIFGIQWGTPSAVALFAIGTIFSASTFGLLVNAFIKSTKQGGLIFGGLLTVTGMVGMMDIFVGNAGATRFGIVPLFTPQGWSARSMLAAMNGAYAPDLLPNLLAMLAMSIAFFAIGVWRFQKRYA